MRSTWTKRTHEFVNDTVRAGVNRRCWLDDWSKPACVTLRSTPAIGMTTVIFSGRWTTNWCDTTVRSVCLIQDLHERGMLDDTLVITAGEFGRTPRINENAGRDHWPQAQSILIAGGGYRHGQVIGSTNSKAEYPTSRAISPADFNAIVYHAVGLNPDDTIRDPSGRPTKLVPGGEVPFEMI